MGDVLADTVVCVIDNDGYVNRNVIRQTVPDRAAARKAKGPLEAALCRVG